GTWSADDYRDAKSEVSTKRTMLAIAGHRHHALEGAARRDGILGIDGDIENVLTEGALDRVERDHLHVRAVQATADASIGGDEIAAGKSFLELVDEGPLRGDDEGAGLGMAFHRGDHPGGGADFVGQGEN